jgi:hypothetical protein
MAALESAGQLGRGDEVNRQAEVANLTKCRDSLQKACRHKRATKRSLLTGIQFRPCTSPCADVEHNTLSMVAFASITDISMEINKSAICVLFGEDRRLQRRRRTVPYHARDKHTSDFLQ